MRFLYIFLSMLILIQVTAGRAQIPQTLTYQGYLTDISGDPVEDGDHSIVFRLYDARENGIQLWEGKQTVTTINGVFGVILGQTIPLELPFDRPYWLSIELGEDGILLEPGIELTASAYSLNSRSVADSVITGPKIAEAQVVRSINNQTDHVQLLAGDNITISSEDRNIVISSAAGTDNNSINSLDAAGGTIENAVFVDEKGRVGIGTSEPKQKLDIRGNLELPASSLSENDSTGMIIADGKRYIYSPGDFNFFAGQEAGRLDIVTGFDGAQFNTAVGNRALNSITEGSSNTAIGAFALPSNTTGHDNIAIGQAMSKNTAGHNNVSVGNFTMQNNTTGFLNVAVGNSALVFNETGHKNTAIGSNALANNKVGDSNVAVGSSAIGNHNEGDRNTAVGNSALLQNSTGENNVALGSAALQNNEAGSTNTAVGYFAMTVNKTGNNNTVIGAQANMIGDDLTNATAIGANARVDASNKIRLGNDDVNVVEANAVFYSLNGGFKFPDGTVQTSAASGNSLSLPFSGSGSTSSPEQPLLSVTNKGQGAGIFVSSDNSDANDLILGASDGTDNGDDGRIASDPKQPSSDIILTSNDDIIIKLDDDASEEPADFEVRGFKDQSLFRVDQNGDANLAGTLVEKSDRNAKSNISRVDVHAVLAAVSQLPITRWTYRNNPDVRHIGPMAQDFKAAFAVGDDETSISTIDRDGVALAAIQALYQIVMQQQKTIEELKHKLAKK